MVRPEKLAALKERMESLGIREQDLEESFVRGAGRGGQKVNKTNNCVYLKHVPTGSSGRQRKTCKQSPWTHRCMYPCSMGNFR